MQATQTWIQNAINMWNKHRMTKETAKSPQKREVSASGLWNAWKAGKMNARRFFALSEM